MRGRVAALSALAAVVSSAPCALGEPWHYVSYGPLFAAGQATAALIGGVRPHPIAAIAGWATMAFAWFLAPLFMAIFADPQIAQPTIGWAVGGAFAATFIAIGCVLLSLDLSAVALPLMILGGIAWGIYAGQFETAANVLCAIGFQVPMSLACAFWLTMPPRRSGILHRLLDEIFD